MHEVRTSGTTSTSPPSAGDFTGSTLRQFVFFVLNSCDVIDNNTIMECFREQDGDAMIDMLRHGEEEAISSVSEFDKFVGMSEELPEPPPNSSDAEIKGILYMWPFNSTPLSLSYTSVLYII